MPERRRDLPRNRRPARRGHAVDTLGIALPEARRFEEAITAYQDAVEIFRETRDRHREGMALDNLGTALGEAAGLRRRSPLTRTPPRSSGRPATGTARVWR